MIAPRDCRRQFSITLTVTWQKIPTTIQIYHIFYYRQATNRSQPGVCSMTACGVCPHSVLWSSQGILATGRGPYRLDDLMHPCAILTSLCSPLSSTPTSQKYGQRRPWPLPPKVSPLRKLAHSSSLSLGSPSWGFDSLSSGWAGKALAGIILARTQRRIGLARARQNHTIGDPYPRHATAPEP